MVTRPRNSDFPIAPPVEPMLAKLADQLPREGEYLYEPKWDGFRALVFRGTSELFIQSRDLRPFDRYFPELHETLLARLISASRTGLTAASSAPVPRRHRAS